MSIPQPERGEARIRQDVIGVNYVDILQRSGRYPVQLPAGLGSEAAGVVTAVGPEVDGVAVGDRVAYGASAPGAYASERIVPADLLVKLPSGVDSSTAAGAMSAGLTAGYLLRRMWPLDAGDAILITAAAGSVGQIVAQWAKLLGLTVLGTVGSAAKVAAAEAAGCDYVLVHGQDDIEAQVRGLTDGDGVAVAYDSVGAATFDASLRSVKRRGLLVSFGAASGPVPAFELGRLAAQGSIYVSRPRLMDYLQDPAERSRLTTELLGHLATGRIAIAAHHRYQFIEAAQAHRDIEARKTTGSVLLLT
ncbi:quinone oxidoreductase family protein [Nocardia aobensis]|uniref:Quinone oxidoreductase family protein n=1 Tax=Nocardia aobensis TaxID=257277 RepID=A0ABW6PF95_9NOCA